MHMVAARLGFEKAMVGTRRATPRSDCMGRLKKHYSHLAEGWFLARKAAWSLSGCMATDSADSGGVGQDHVQQLLLTLHSFHYGVLHREKKHMASTNSCVFRLV